MAFSYPAIVFGQTRCHEGDRHPGGESVAHLWTGPLNGYYFQVGKAIAAASKHMPDEIRIHYCISNGSESNLAALLDGHADFAIVQGDVAHQFWHCDGPEAPLLWTFAALWLQASEGDLNEHFATLSASALSLARNVLAKLPLQFSSAPRPLHGRAPRSSPSLVISP